MSDVLLDKAKGVLVRDEGWRRMPYRCTAGKISIGVGRNLEDKGLNDIEVGFLLNNDLIEVLDDLQKIFSNFLFMSDERKLALISLRHQLGYGGFRSFKRMNKAISKDNWREAIKEFIDSKYYRTPELRKRADRIVTGFLSGGGF